MAWDFELVAGPYGGLVDALAWDGQALLFSVLSENNLLRYQPDSHRVSVFRPYWIRIRGLALDRDGTLYGAQAGSRRIVRFNTDGSASPIRAWLDGQMHNCPEDLVIDGEGRIWFSDPYDTVVPRGPDIKPLLDHASVLRLTRGGDGTWQLERMTFDTRYPRSVLLSKDERTLYVGDGPLDATAELRAYPIRDDGTLGAGQTLHRFTDGGVDGLCLDRDGNIVACAAEVQVFAPDGRLLESCPTPAGRPADCAFGDADLGALYVSTTEGHLFRVRPDKTSAGARSQR
jgi:gluconolactonase